MEYCQKMKTVADALRDVGHTVPDSQLVLNLLRAVNPHFTTTADDLANSTMFPTFTQARELLALKELRLANEAKVATNRLCSPTPATPATRWWISLAPWVRRSPTAPSSSTSFAA